MGMTRIFDDMGSDYPVTIIEAGPCSITQIKTTEKDGYSAVQIGFQDKKDHLTNKAELGHFNKAKVPVKNILKEIAIDNLNGVNVGQNFGVNIFEKGDFVTITGISKGKGFAGHMKRHGFSGGRRSHGKNSVMRKAGSVGAGTSPGRVWAGTRMAGRMGNDQVSTKNLKVIRIENNNNLLFVRGAIPGSKQSIVYIAKQ